MAFNSPSPKYPIVYRSALEEAARVGPGSYNVCRSNQSLPNNGSQYVFKSKLQRSVEKQNDSSQQSIGPGQYDIDTAHRKFIVRTKINGCQASFESKIQRFPAPRKDKDEAEQQDDTNVYGFLLGEQSAKRKLGKLFGIIRDRKNVSQSIPSIPTNQQSYGYRVDQKTKKLVQNENPNVLLARKTLTTEIDPSIFATTSSYYNGCDSLFAKDIRKIKGLKWNKQNTKSPRSSERQKENENNSSADCVNKQDLKQSRNSIQSAWNKKGNALVSKETRFEYQNVDKRNELLINSLKKKYFEFISEDKETENILRKRIEEGNAKINNFKQEKILNRIQCFLSQQNRFPEKIQKSQLTILQNKKEPQSILQEKTPKISPFGSKSPRFNDNLKENNRRIGPGSYQVSSERPKVSGIRPKDISNRFTQPMEIEGVNKK